MSLNMNIKEGNEEHHSLMDSTHRGMSANAAPETIELTVPESLKREAGAHILTVFPSLRHSHSPTNPRPPTVWLVQFVALLTLTLAALATNIALLLKTLGFKNERNGTLCYNKSGGRYRCRSARSQTYDMSLVCLGGSIAVLYRNHTSQCRTPTFLNSIDNLLTHPATLQALSSELVTANLTLPYPKWNEVCDLPYLDACIQEARVVPAGGVTVLNHYLPEGTLVGGNPYVVNRHAETFGPDVEEWRPERRLEGEGRKRLEQSVPTFGAGRRVCLGKYIGILELKRLVSFLVLKYDMKIIDPERFSVENGFFFKQRGFYCNITRRKEGSDRDKADSK
ncbi:cytochrome P450 [Aspergillus minisclerotigenes]|uniref:Cytochrome P450 n=1 Tax=Aspergillus minisclerotigenes TaxID=656917 RepID=A0A5N6IJ76_9EURO|nr:cytochrome P450 [Aspergillus minisclerotigenes]